MARHLAACAPAHDVPTGEAEPILRLRVEGYYDTAYWLDVEMKTSARLRSLDQFLRDTWLECCGHLSAFTIAGIRYQPEAVAAIRSPFPLFDRPRIRSMDAPLGDTASLQQRIEYEYDFGSTTRLRLRVTHVRGGWLGRRALRLLARNDPIPWHCSVCGAPAVTLCTACPELLADVLFCEDHGRTHEAANHGDGGGMLLPVVNSPRMGVCAYAGPDMCHP